MNKEINIVIGIILVSMGTFTYFMVYFRDIRYLVPIKKILEMDAADPRLFFIKLCILTILLQKNLECMDIVMRLL